MTTQKPRVLVRLGGYDSSKPSARALGAWLTFAVIVECCRSIRRRRRRWGRWLELLHEFCPGNPCSPPQHTAQGTSTKSDSTCTWQWKAETRYPSTGQ